MDPKLHIAGLTSTHRMGSGTKLLERGWTLTCLGNCPVRANPQLSASVLVVLLGE